MREAENETIHGPRGGRRRALARAGVVVGLLALGSACRRAESPQETSSTASSITSSTASSTASSGGAKPEAAGEAAPKPALPPLPGHPILDAGIRAARDAAQRRLLDDGDPLQPDLLLVGEKPKAQGPAALPGHFVPLELPPNADPLGRFEAALAELEAGTRTKPVRLAFYGASGVASDKWTGFVRAYLQERFGSGGPGIVPAAPPHAWTRHMEVKFASSKGWTRHNSFQLGQLDPPAPFGVMGQAMSAHAIGAWTQIEPLASSPSARELEFYEIHYLVQPGGGSFGVRLDGREIGEVSTSSDASSDAGGQRRLGKHRVKLRPGQEHTLRLELRGDGEVWLLGIVAETGEPGIVLDSLGANGARTENQIRWDEDLWTAHLRERDPVLYVLAYGNNESVDEDVPISAYERQYVEVLDRFARALPEAGCVMIGPGDYPIVEGKEIRPRPRLAKIREVQRSLAPIYGCAFLDTRAVFGGVGSKASWVEAGLGKSDYLHLSRAGYLRFGLAVSDALMQRYDWRAQLAGLDQAG